MPFRFIGTEQPRDIADVKAKERNRFLPVWQQDVRDEQGRKRLHGAFTGGFSAGYFNTVGSKEGWAPSSFSSSRKNRADARALTAEDFMDEEDKREQFQGPSLTKDYDLFADERSATKAAKPQQRDKLDLIVRPVTDTVGVKLMRLMGWREGQAIGPRLKRKTTDTSSQEDVHAAQYTFAPKLAANVPNEIIQVRKNNTGLGYVPSIEQHRKQQEILPSRDTKMAAPVPSRTGFGVGVFEDEDADIYDDVSDAIKYTTVIQDEEEPEPLIVPAPIERDKKQAAPSNGQVALPNFVFAGTIGFSSKWFEAPSLPKDYEPKCPFSSNEKTEKRNSRNLTVDQRRQILGEEALPGPHIRPSRMEQEVPLDIADIAVSVEQANSAMKGFIPFANDPAKQQRYLSFLRLKAGEQELVRFPPHMSVTDKNHELVEFGKAALLYKPLNSLMSSKFTSASAADSQLTSASVEKKREEASRAVHIVVYGKATRTVSEWRPAPLLCKRLGLAVPVFDEQAQEASANSDANNFLALGIPPELAAEKIQEPQVEEEDEEEVELYVRPSMDLFKSVFADSEDEESEPQVPVESATIESQDSVQVAPVSVPAKVSEEPKVVLPPPTFRPVFTKRENRLKTRLPKQKEETPKKTKVPQKRTISFADELEDDSDEGDRPKASKYM